LAGLHSPPYLCGRQVLTEYCPGEIEEANVCKHAFELVFAFDEVVAMGHKENVTMRDIQINIEMESHEEKHSSTAKRPPPGQCPSTAPVPPQSAPSGSGRLNTLRGRRRPGHWAPRSCLGCELSASKEPICIIAFGHAG
jgi:hypothetical protein